MKLKIRKQTIHSVHFELKCEPEDLPIVGNFMQTDDPEQDAKDAAELQAKLDSGDQWAWCYVVVLAKMGPWTGRAGLGGCSYKDRYDFIGSGEYAQLQQDAVRNLNAQLEEQARNLEPFLE